MFELLARVADVDPDRIAVVTHDVELTYGELVERSLRAAAWLAETSLGRLGVADFEADVAVPLLAGASVVGVQACLYPPDDPATIADLRTRMEHDVVVSDRDDLDDVGGRVVPPAGLFAGAAAGGDGPGPAARPHLVLTTGTTGAPRGVRHDWSRLVRSVDRVRPGVGQRWLLAYGLHQFAGLQVLLHVFAAGATLVAPAPRRPRAGLRALRELGVTHASATPTYWRFLVAEMDADGGPAPALQQITMGGEAVPGAVLERVRRAFPSATVSQVYAASEFGSTGSVRDGRPGLSAAVLERGDDADVALKVVDGELWVRSRIGMLGYHGEPEIDPDAWRPTGDLVEVVGDRIEFRGRTSEIINVGGVKVHPLPIEDRVGAVPGVAAVRVFARPNPMTGSIVAVEVVAEPGADEALLRTAVRESCADLPAAARPRRVTLVDSLQTVGGKIIRR